MLGKTNHLVFRPLGLDDVDESVPVGIFRGAFLTRSKDLRMRCIGSVNDDDTYAGLTFDDVRLHGSGRNIVKRFFIQRFQQSAILT